MLIGAIALVERDGRRLKAERLLPLPFGACVVEHGDMCFPRERW